MNNFDFIRTDDNSTGLYSYDANDIFHSKTGALKEAYEKFINPAEFIFDTKTEIKILDICSGIGYNLKAALTKLKNKSGVIDCIDIDSSLIKLSPFILDAIDDIELKIYLLSEVIRNNISVDEIAESLNIHLKRENEQFFSSDMINLVKLLQKDPSYLSYQPQLSTFLHNIYYKYISNSMTERKISSNYNKITINYHIDDARKSLTKLNNVYDVIFLDAFSPQKDPTLWTIDFIQKIKAHMHTASMLLSYSKSTPFRSALVELGFTVGKTFIDNIDMGTVASLDSSIIKNKLSEYDIKLLNTRSGITYKDLLLSSTAKEIIKYREQEQKTSNRLSHTQFLKRYKS